MNIDTLNKIEDLFKDLYYDFEDMKNETDSLEKELAKRYENIISLAEENYKLRADIELLTRELEEVGEALCRFGELYD